MDRFQTRTVAEHIIRDTGNTKSDLCKIDQQIVAAEFDFGYQIQLALLADVVKKFAGHTALVQHQNRILQQFFKVQRMILQMFKVPVEKHGINGHLRQKGKIAELALGYGGSVGVLKAMGALDMGLTEEELHPW